MKHKKLKCCLSLILAFTTLSSCDDNSTEDSSRTTNTSSFSTSNTSSITSGTSTGNSSSTTNTSSTTSTSSSTVSHTHEYGEWKVTKKPTTSSTGIIERVCSVGNETDSSTLPVLNETDYELTVIEKSTCSIKGKGKYIYSKDNQKLEIDGEVAVNPNHHVDVDENSICTSCNAAVDLTFNSDGFNDTNNTCVVSKVKNSPINIIIPDTVTKNGKTYTVNEINASAFGNCTTLESVEMSDNITTCGVLCFSNCTSLKSVKLSKNLTKLTFTFYGCTALENITLPDSLITIDNNSFYKCESLKCLDIPDSVTYLGGSVFGNCTNLEYLLVPISIKALGSTFNDNTNANLFVKGTKEEAQATDYFSTQIEEFDWIFYSEKTPDDSTSKYWHYDDNHKPVKW